MNGIGDDQPTLGDLMWLVDHLFIGGIAIGCPEEANIDGSTVAPILSHNDIILLMTHLFVTETPPQVCPGSAAAPPATDVLSGITETTNIGDNDNETDPARYHERRRDFIPGRAYRAVCSGTG